MDKIFEKTEDKVCSDYRSWIIEMVEKIENISSLKRLLNLTEYLYVHKEK